MIDPTASTEDAGPAPALPTFDVIPLGADLRKAVDAMGYKHPTPVQRAVFEPAVRGKSLVVQARTGTGKTAAFGLPILDQLIRRSVPKVQALILTPTRELALQVSRELEKLAQVRGTKIIAIYGGAPMGKQIEALEAGAQIVVGTPGRVLDHLRRKTLDPSNIRIFVLDEADEMLSMGFAKELHAIADSLPKERQGLFFSATIPPDIERLAVAQLRDPEFVTLSSDQVGALEINHFVYMLRGGDKRQQLIRIIEVEDPESAVVFCNTKDETERVAEALRNQGFDAEWLNGDLEQRERERVMAKTREGKLRFLVATDVAARGIDISHLTHVINHDFPENAEGYVHRTGRTGRAGRTGTAISILGPKDIGNLYILRLTYKIRPIEKQLPTAGELKTRAEQDLVQLFEEAFALRAAHVDDLALARRLLTHVDAEKILAGLLRDHLGARAADPVAEAAEARRAKNPSPLVEPPLADVPELAAAIPAADPRDESRDRGRPARPPRDDRGGRRERERPRREPPSTSSPGFTVEPNLPKAPAPFVAPPIAPIAPIAATLATTPVAEDPRRRERAPRPSRGGVPHKSFTTWEPPEEQDDDKPILAAPPWTETPLAPPPQRPSSDEMLDDPSFAQVFVNVGRRDGARTSDLQRLLEATGVLAAGELGRIRVRDRMTFIGVRKESLERAIAALSGQVIGGRTVIAEPAKPKPPRGSGSSDSTPDE